jgi:hypothetical protein
VRGHDRRGEGQAAEILQNAKRKTAEIEAKTAALEVHFKSTMDTIASGWTRRRIALPWLKPIRPAGWKRPSKVDKSGMGQNLSTMSA